MFRSQRKTQEQSSTKNSSNQQGEVAPTTEYSLEKFKFPKQRLIIFCDPNYPIYFLESFIQFVKPYLSVSVSAHVHSTVENFPKKLAGFCSDFSNMSADVDIQIILIWKATGIDPIMELPEAHRISGVINIARYLNRVVELVGDDILIYEKTDPLYANKIDAYLERIDRALHGIDTNVLQQTSKKTRYVLGSRISIVDILESKYTYKND